MQIALNFLIGAFKILSSTSSTPPVCLPCQSGVDYSKVESSSIGAVLIRAGYGRETYQKDSQFETHYRNAKANGLIIGAYWYSYANSVEDAKREAKACLACISGIIGNVDVDLVIKLTSSPSTTSTTQNCNATVKDVQKEINIRYNVGLVVDGIYGAKTKAALVKALQKSLNNRYNAGLVADGVYGTKTKAAVRNVAYGTSGDIVEVLQALLICNGYTLSLLDGIYGYLTITAVRNYQSAHKLNVDGVAGKATFTSLCK